MSSLDSIALFTQQLSDGGLPISWQSGLRKASVEFMAASVRFTLSLRKCEALRDKEPLSSSNGDSSSLFFPHHVVPFKASHTDLV